ncbi:MAG: adenylate/guanylate cyclase domain-containing protein, partial [Bacteroidota bacterium]
DATGRIGEEKKVAIVFADIVSYTPFAESLPAYDVIHVLDRYFYLIGNVIKENNGRIIDYYGDGVLAVFGIKNEESAAIDSIKASCEMFDSLEKLNPYLQRMYKRNFNIRVGLHYGSVIIGTIGIEDSRKFTAIGDAVNFASRIESANKNHGTNFLISQDAYTAVKEHIKTGKVVNEKLKGKTGSHSLYEVLGLKDS